MKDGLERDRRIWKSLRLGLGLLCFPLGVATAGITFLLGGCASFGGACTPEPLLQNDVFGGIATGLALAFGGPLLAARPDRTGVLGFLCLVVPVALGTGYLLGS